MRTVLFQSEKSALRVQPNESAATKAYAERGAVAVVEECSRDWCKVTAGRVTGWAQKTNLWGVAPDEVLN